MFGLQLMTSPWLKIRLVCPILQATNCLSTKDSLPPVPRKPLSSYVIFFKENFSQVRDIHPNLKMTDVARLVAANWAKIDQTFKDEKMVGYKEQLKKYYEAKEAYLAALSPSQLISINEANDLLKLRRSDLRIKIAQREHGIPKRPGTSFGMFLKDQVKIKNIKASPEITKLLAKEWKLLDSESKKHYSEQYKQGLADYAVNISKWEEEMIRQGKEYLVRPQSRVDGRLPIKKLSLKPYKY